MEGIIISPEDIKTITQNITPEETQYVMDVRSTLDDTNASSENEKDILFLGKLIAFEQKFRAIDLTTVNMSYKSVIQDFSWVIKDFTENISIIIQSIIGEVQGSAISKISLPVSDNPLELINELKIMLQNWSELHKDDREYKGAVTVTDQFLAEVHKFIYKFRSNRSCDCDCYVKQINNTPINIPTIIGF